MENQTTTEIALLTNAVGRLEQMFSKLSDRLEAMNENHAIVKEAISQKIYEEVAPIEKRVDGLELEVVQLKLISKCAIALAGLMAAGLMAIAVPNVFRTAAHPGSASAQSK